MRRHHLLFWSTLALASSTALAVPAYTITDLGTLGGDSSEGTGINAGGQVTGVGDSGAFLWDGTDMLDLNDLIAPGSGWILGQGNAINDAGQIAGSGFIGGQQHAFLLTPIAVTEVPEPGALVLIAVGGIGLGWVRHRRHQNG